MKQLKSRAQDLRTLFEDNITIAHIAEPLKAVPASQSALEVLAWMQTCDFDAVGVESNGVVNGYVERSHLTRSTAGLCSDCQQVFHPAELIAISTPLMQLLPLMQHTPRLFVLEGNRVSGIVTYGDLQKAPVRMLLFGLVTLLEMNLLRLIRRYYAQNTWQSTLKADRVQTAQRLWQESRDRNEATDLLDYLQFCDKRDLVLHHPELFRQLGLKSKRGGDRLLKQAEQLRNRLAHAQNLVSGSSWGELLALTAELESLLRQCEIVEP